MTLEEAIEILKAIQDTGEYTGDPDDSVAVQLGIEALKTIKAERTIYGFRRQVRLPGETEE